MAAPPDHSAILRAVYDRGHYDLSTKIGSGRFVNEDGVAALAKVDPNWGRLRKRPGQNNWQGNAVDNPLYLSLIPGQSTAVDVVAASESSDARLQWSPDQPRYSAADWQAGPQPPFVLPPHHCKLGASLFWYFGAWRRYRHGELGFKAKIDRNAEWLKDRLHADYVRDFATVGGRVDPRTGKDPWGIIGSFYRWPDWVEVIASGLDYLWDQWSLQHALTLVGEGAQFAGESEVLQMVEGIAQILHPRKAQIFFVEMWNERHITGGNDRIVRAMAERLHQLLPDVPLALDTPAYAMGGLTDGNLQPLWDEVAALYGGSPATVITPQWNRAEPNPLDCGPASRRLKFVAHEPRGPEASAGGNVHDPLPLMHDYIQAAIASQIHMAGPTDYDGYTAHSAPGVWGGLCDPAFPAQNRYADWPQLPTAAGIASALSAIRAGHLPDAPVPPDPPDPEPADMIPRPDFAARLAEINAFYAAPEGLKRPGGMVIDSATPVPADLTALTQWGYDLAAGVPVNQIKNAIVRGTEWASKHPGVPPPTYPV